MLRIKEYFWTLFYAENMFVLRSKAELRAGNSRFAEKNVRFAHFFGEQPEQFAHGCLFLVSDLRKSLMVAHFW